MYTVTRFQHSMIGIAALLAVMFVLCFTVNMIPKDAVEFIGYFMIGWLSAKSTQWLVDKFFEIE